jgi:hypothetical protein
METPVFRLGLVGFNEREEQLLRAGAAAYRQVDWRCGRAEGADAWVIKGARIARIQDNRLRVVASEGTNTGSAFLLDVGSRPVAIATPAPQQVAQLAPLFFDPAQDAALAGALATLDAQLDRLRRQYWAAALLVEHNATVGKALYELRTFDQVLAVADMKGTVHIAPGATSDQFDHAVWRHRARKSVEALADFERHPLAELLWSYATRTRRDLLPARYKDQSIHLRRPPRVPAERVGDVHLRIVRELAVGPASMAGLAEKIGVDDKTLERSMAALYLVGSVTTNPERAWSTSEQGALWSTRSGAFNAASLQAPGPDTEGMPSTAPLM